MFYGTQRKRSIGREDTRIYANCWDLLGALVDLSGVRKKNNPELGPRGHENAPELLIRSYEILSDVTTYDNMIQHDTT